MIDLDEIIPDRLWVGAYVRPDTVPELLLLGITTVVSLQTDEDLWLHGITPAELAAAYRKAGIEWRRVPTPDFDSKALAHSLPAAVREVENALGNPDTRLYLHCTVGINRSATTAAGFLILTRGISAKEACQYMTSRRDCNPTFEVLCGYEEMIRSSKP